MTPLSSGPTLPSRPCTSGKNEVKPHSWGWERDSSGLEPQGDSRELPQRVTSPPAAAPGRASAGGGGTEPVVPFPSALRDNRIQLERSTPNELTISISDVVLADEGEYTCSIFTMPVRTAKALVTVLGRTQGQSPCSPSAPIASLCVSHSVCHTVVAAHTQLTDLWVLSPPPPPPGIPQKPQIFGHEQPIDEEKVARLICRSSGSKPAAQLRWRKGNRELKGG